jgi:hypothetical protein
MKRLGRRVKSIWCEHLVAMWLQRAQVIGAQFTRRPKRPRAWAKPSREADG